MTEVIVMRLIVRILAPIFLLLGLIGPAGGATAAPAQSVRTEEVFAAVNMCTGEFVPLEGTVHIVSQEREDGSAFTYVTYHMKGIGDQGNRYVFNDTLHVRFKSSTGHFTADERYRLVSEGSAPNQWIIIHFDSNTGSTFEADCRG
jgi:hypothetical protein